MTGSTLRGRPRRAACRAAAGALVALLVAGATATAAATPAAAAPALGRWEGTTKDGGRVAFVVAYLGRRRVAAAPSATCPRREDPFYHQGPEVSTFQQDWEHGNAFARHHRSDALGTDGSFAIQLGFDRRALAGRLKRSTGVVQVSAQQAPGGCRFRRVKVRRVGRAFGDGIYLSSGSFLTRGKFAVYSGGGLVVPDTVTWGGPPEPRITQQLGPAAGMLACTAAYAIGAMATGPLGGWGVDEDFRDHLNVVGKLNVRAVFVTRTSFAGRFEGDLTTLSMTKCPLKGVFAGTRLIAPRGKQLSYKAPKSRRR